MKTYHVAGKKYLQDRYLLKDLYPKIQKELLKFNSKVNVCRSPYSPGPVSQEQLPIAGEEKCPGSFQVSIKPGAAFGTLGSRSQIAETERSRYYFPKTTVPLNFHFCAGNLGQFGGGEGEG